MKPARFFATEMGFHYSGEGIITDYVKGTPVTGNTVTLYVMSYSISPANLKNRDTENLKLKKWTGYVTVSQARENIELNPAGKFTNKFKIGLLNYLFKYKDFETVGSFIEDLKEHEDLF